MNKKAKAVSNRRAKEHIKNEEVYRRLEKAKEKADKAFVEINAKLDAFNKPSDETIAIGQFMQAVLTSPNTHGFDDTGEVMELLIPLTGV